MAACLSSEAAAQQPAPQPVPTVLDAVTVTATRVEQSLKDVPSTVTVIDAEEIDRRNVQDIRDLVRYEPGVSVGNAPARQGIGSFVIRGIGQNRVLITVDGVRVPDAPVNSQPGTYMRDYVDVESLKRVEIVRGPASALHGSDAIGGVVAYITKDPSDYLDGLGKDWHVSGKAGYDSADHSFAETVTLAGRVGNFDVMFLGTRRDGEETENNGSIDANPQDYWVNNMLSKIVYRPSESDRFRLTAEYTDRRVKTDIRSELSPTVTDSKGKDDTTRRRISLDHVHETGGGFVDRIKWLIAYQSIDRDEHSDQRRRSGANSLLRLTDQSFTQDIIGVNLQLEKDFQLAGVPNRLIYGFDVDFFDTKRPRDRTEFNLTTGTTSKFVAGERFPNKVFPDSDTILGGVYVQDELQFAGGRLSVVPALRVDYYRLDPDSDAAFEANNPTARIGKVSETAVSPKLGAVYRLDDTYSVFAQYAHGFRSPPYDDANIGFTNQAFGYQILPNPDLKPEESDGVEIGLRGRFDNGSYFSASAFYTKYKDFIEQRQIGFSPAGLILFQSQNLDRVTIYGAEAKGEWRFADRFALMGAIAYARGEDDDTGLPVDSVDPLKAVLGLRYADPANWGLELIGTAVDRKDRVSDATFFKAPGYGIVDLIGYYDIGTAFSVNAGLFNILDKKYWIAQDVATVSAVDPRLELFTQPGRTFGVNVTMRW